MREARKQETREETYEMTNIESMKYVELKIVHKSLNNVNNIITESMFGT